MPDSHNPQENHLLAALSPAERERIYPHLDLVPMPLGKVLYESGDTLRHVYFPIDSIVSLLYVLADGASAEISVVGNEGLIGIALFMGGETTPSRALVQSAGNAYRLIGQRLTDRLGQQFVVENRPGAGSSMAAQDVVAATADGYTLLLAANANTVNTSLYPNLPFNFVRDIAAVGMICSAPNVLIANPAMPAKPVPSP